MARRFRIVLAAAFALAVSLPAAAQDDIEPRIVGARGVTTVGISGFIDTFQSNEDTFPRRATLHVDLSRFVTAKWVARVGLTGTTAFGDDSDDAVSGPGAETIDGRAGLFYYFTPASMLSLYLGAEYRTPLTNRAEQEAGSTLGIGGVQAALSSRAALFVEAGYGARLTRGDEGEWQTRMAGAIGVRVRFE